MAELLLRGVVVTSCFFWLLSIMPQLTVPYVLDVCVQLTSGLRHLHDHGIVHRDLKADNALVASTAPLTVKWADFGCSEKLVKSVPSTYCAGCLPQTSYYESADSNNNYALDYYDASNDLPWCPPVSLCSRALTTLATCLWNPVWFCFPLVGVLNLAIVACDSDVQQLTSTQQISRRWRGVRVRRSFPTRPRARSSRRRLTCSCWAAPSSRC